MLIRKWAVVVMALFSVVGWTAPAKPPRPPKQPPPGAASVGGYERRNTLYTLGYFVGMRVINLHIREDELPAFLEGVASDEYLPPTEEGRQRLYEQLAARRKEQVLQREVAAGEAALAAAAKEKGAVVSVSGAVFKELKPGAGKKPLEGMTVDLRFRASLANGHVFAASPEEGRGVERIDVWSQTQCMREAVVQLREGGKARIWCPQSLAFAEEGDDRRRVPPGAAVIYELELVKIW